MWTRSNEQQKEEGSIRIMYVMISKQPNNQTLVHAAQHQRLLLPLTIRTKTIHVANIGWDRTPKVIVVHDQRD